MKKTVYKWQHRKHLLTLLCKHLNLKLRCRMLKLEANALEPKGFYYEITAPNGHELEALSARTKMCTGSWLHNLRSYKYEREAINDMFSFLTRIVKVGLVYKSLSERDIKWIPFTNEDELKLQLVVAGAWEDIKNDGKV